MAGQRNICAIKSDFCDIIAVVAYSNINLITIPPPLLPPTFIPAAPTETGTTARVTLNLTINYLPGGFGLPEDIQQVLNGFILTNLVAISTQPTLRA